MMTLVTSVCTYRAPLSPRGSSEEVWRMTAVSGPNEAAWGPAGDLRPHVPEFRCWPRSVLAFRPWTAGPVSLVLQEPLWIGSAGLRGCRVVPWAPGACSCLQAPGGTCKRPHAPFRQTRDGSANTHWPSGPVARGQEHIQNPESLIPRFLVLASFCGRAAPRS